MEAALVWYILLNLAIFGFVLLFVRAARARVTPNEPKDLEENALVHADWERVRRERCLPSRCLRVIGQPPRPRKDVTCEVCAATFLEMRLRRLLEGPLAPEPAGPETADGVLSDGMPLSSHPITPSPCHPVCRRGDRLALDPPEPEVGHWRGPRKRSPAATTRRWALVRFGLGITFLAGGAAIAAFGGGLLWLIMLGCLMVLIGLGLMASGAASGEI
jgi:hypothetical protein